MTDNDAYALAMTGYIEYWKCTLMGLKKPLPTQPCTLLEGLWPTNDWRRFQNTVGHKRAEGVGTTLEDKDHFDHCSPTKEKLNPPFNL